MEQQTLTNPLAHKRIIVGVTGGIAAYKSAELVRRLKEHGAQVRVVMTENAKQFITPLTMQAVSANPVHQHFIDADAEAAMGHIELARWAELILIAPASAHFLAELAHGFANHLLATLCLATRAPIVVAPAMNQHMWQHPSTQANLTHLIKLGIQPIGPTEGSQACGDVGPGRMAEPDDIVRIITTQFSPPLLTKQRILITAGPTQEAIDPVRYLSNRSSGKMGYAIARAAKEAGAEVTLISGPTHLPTPAYVTRIDVTSAEQMFAAVCENIHACDIFIGAAAVADYRPQHPIQQKIKKSQHPIQLSLLPNPDIIAHVATLTPKPYVIGFAAETDHLLQHAQEKLSVKQLDMVIANQVGLTQGGFDSNDNAVSIITKNRTLVLGLENKYLIAKKLVTIIAEEMS